MALASSPFVRRLKRLHLDDNRLGDAGVAALLGAPFLTGLRTLSIAQNNITAGGIVLLGGAPPELEALDLSRNPLRREGLDAMCAALPRLRLRKLALSDCELPGSAMPSLLHAAPRTLAELSVAGNAFGAEWRTRDDAQVAARLLCLDLSRNALGPAALIAMAARPELSSLVVLRANSNVLGDDDAVRLAHGLSQLSALEVLQLRDNALGPSTMAAMVRSPLAARVKTLDLGLNQLGDAGAAALAEPPGLPALRVLDLEQNGIAFAAAASILAAPGMPLLQTVGFARNALKSVVDLHSLARRKIELLETTFARVAAGGADLAERFYSRLFERYPAVRPLFAHTAMRRQQQHLIAALTMVIEHLRAPDLVLPALTAMAERHVGYGVYPSHYQAFVTTMIDTLRDILGSAWTPDMEDAWHDGLEAIASAMMRAQQDAASRDRGEVMRLQGA
jgi:hemoglobin-like flavoprotein/Ran GTPase-activating protein (RanGAP) involved in mRNA processing and transport